MRRISREILRQWLLLAGDRDRRPEPLTLRIARPAIGEEHLKARDLILMRNCETDWSLARVTKKRDIAFGKRGDAAAECNLDALLELRYQPLGPVDSDWRHRGASDDQVGAALRW